MTSSHLSDTPPASAAPAERKPSGFGIAPVVLLVLAAISVPRIIVHDLQLLPPGAVATTLLAVVPAVIWVVVAAVWSTRPLPTLLITGGLYGVALAVVHNLMWSQVLGRDVPGLGGNLDGLFSPFTQEILVRGAATLSSIGTGLAVGLVTGLIAWGVQSLLRRGGLRLPR